MKGDPLRLVMVPRDPYPTGWPCLETLYSRRFTARGHEVTWFQQAGRLSGIRRIRKGERERFVITPALTPRGPVSRAVNQLLGWLFSFYLWRVVDPRQHDAVQVRDRHWIALVGQWVARRRGIPFFYWMSFPYAEADSFRARDLREQLSWVRRVFYAWRGAVGQWLLYRHVLPRADQVFVTSNQMKKDLVERGMAAERITPTPMAADLDDTRDISACDDPRLKNRAAVVYLGTVDPMRRLGLLIDALVLVKRRRPDAILVYVGGDFPAERERLKRHAATLGLDNDVLFTGQLSRPDAWRYVKAARVSLSPFRPVPILLNASPTKMVESMALGVPVVANEHPDHREVLETSGAGVLVPFTPEGFADGILQLLENPELAASMGRKGPGWVEQNRTFVRTAAVLEDIYIRIIQVGHGEP